MAHSSGIITEQVDISDIQTVLGVASTDLSILSTHENINFWAKNKPVRCNKLDSITASDRELQVADSSRYGLKVITAVGRHPSVLYTAVSNNAGKGFQYLRPSGGDASPYRMGDFSLYNHYAKILFGTANFVNKTYGLGPTEELVFSIDFATKHSGVEIDPTDFYPATTNVANNDIFLGVMALTESGSVIGWTTGEYIKEDDKGNVLERPFNSVKIKPDNVTRNVLLFFFIANEGLNGVWQTRDFSHDIIFYAIPNDAQNPNPVKIGIKAYDPPLPGTIMASAHLRRRSATSGKTLCSISVHLTGGSTGISVQAQTLRVNLYNAAGKLFIFFDYLIPALSAPAGGEDSYFLEDDVLDITYDEIYNYDVTYNNTTYQ